MYVTSGHVQYMVSMYVYVTSGHGAVCGECVCTSLVGTVQYVVSVCVCMSLVGTVQYMMSVHIVLRLFRLFGCVMCD